MTWPTQQVRRLFRVVNGGTPTADPENWDGDVPWATPIDLGLVNGGYLGATDRTLTREGLVTGSRAVPPGSLIVSTRAPIGYVAETRATMAFNQGCRGLVPQATLDTRYFRYQLSAIADRLAASGQGSTFDELSGDALAASKVIVPDLAEQRAIADYLDIETARVDAVLANKRRMLDLLNERVDAEIKEWIGGSELAKGGSGARPAPIGRLLTKLRRRALVAEMVTAYRDGQVTARSLRRAEGYTDAWTGAAQLQGVARDDVVVHGLDAFSGAVGWSEVDGVCSPINHVCVPADGGHPLFYARMLRVLATSGYLGLFATSTRERAVDLRNWDLFGRIPIPVVPAAEQHRIGERIRALVPLKVAVDRSASLAAEHREALITAAVTGELDVPGVAA